jgi:predicted Na+-dependent transporter
MVRVPSRLRLVLAGYPELIAVLAAAILGLSVQPPLAWLVSHQGISILLAVLVFATALTIEPAALRRLTAAWQRLLAAPTAGITVLPALSWAVSRFVTAGPLRDGVMAVGLAPCEIASVATTAMAGGETALAAGLLIGSTVVTVTVAGLILTLEAGHAAAHPAGIITSLALVVALPLAAGLLLRARIPLTARTERGATTTATAAVAALVALIAAEVHLSARYLSVALALVVFLAGTALTGRLLGSRTLRPPGRRVAADDLHARLRHRGSARGCRVRPGRRRSPRPVRDPGAHLGHRRCRPPAQAADQSKTRVTSSVAAEGAPDLGDPLEGAEGEDAGHQVGGGGDGEPDQPSGSPQGQGAIAEHRAGEARLMAVNQAGTASNGSAETAKIMTSMRRTSCSIWIRFHSRVIPAMISE